MAILAVLLLTAATAAFILAPLFRKNTLEDERSSAAKGEIAELFSQREMALAGLRDLEDDRETGKMGEADYRELKGKLQARAVEILRRLDEVQSAPPPAEAPDRR